MYKTEYQDVEHREDEHEPIIVDENTPVKYDATSVQKKVVNLTLLIESLQTTINKSTSKNTSLLKLFRQVNFSQRHVFIRQKFLGELCSLRNSLSSETDDQIILEKLVKLFTNAIKRSSSLHQEQPYKILKRLELKNIDGQKVNLDDCTCLEIGETIATDQHFFLLHLKQTTLPEDADITFDRSLDDYTDKPKC